MRITLDVYIVIDGNLKYDGTILGNVLMMNIDFTGVRELCLFNCL